MIVRMMDLRGRRGKRGMEITIITITTMERDMGKMEKGREGRGVRMRMRRCLSIKAPAGRIKGRVYE